MSNLAQHHLAKSIVSTTESLLKYDQDETLVTSSPQHIHDSLGRSVMISISDNTATNKLIDYCTIPGAQDGFRRMGMKKTQLTRKLFDRAASRSGLRNVICPREIGLLLEKLYRNEFISEAVCKEAIVTLFLQQVDHKLNGRICGEVPIAHKTGEDDHLSNDVGIVYAPQPFVICFAGHDTDVYLWEDLMRNATYELWQAQL